MLFFSERKTNSITIIIASEKDLGASVDIIKIIEVMNKKRQQMLQLPQLKIMVKVIYLNSRKTP